ncbi:glycosyltransferase family 8 protein [Seleniivibrio woodruffii]|uniref:glycosyltransferase family 8 protein n=1 Tax=Seleniivibrio woodruffii TaxID=1078050 RepID=UPI0026F1A262|nr:glycosyltransferase family 8 protein [Seleniivibrio woodruffii]
MSDTLNVVFTIDRNYIIHFSTALLSLLENNRDTDFRIFLIYDGTKSDLEDVCRFFREKYNTEINILSIDPDIFSDFRITHHIRQATYFRLCMAEILPQDIDTLLYLDCDLIVDGSVSELSRTVMDDEYLRGVEHLFPLKNKEHLSRFGIDPESDYFNAGVMLVNLKKWREEGLTKKLMTFALERRHDILWWDQDVLNILLHEKWKKLHPKFNFIWEIMESNSADKEIREAQEKPVIVHYTRSVKPWHSNSYHPYRHLYHKYRAMIPFGDEI